MIRRGPRGYVVLPWAGRHPPLGSLIPSAVVILLAIIGPALDCHDPCASTDAQQFKCYLENLDE